jgi:hypothetical protein
MCEGNGRNNKDPAMAADRPSLDRFCARDHAPVGGAFHGVTDDALARLGRSRRIMDGLHTSELIAEAPQNCRTARADLPCWSCPQIICLTRDHAQQHREGAATGFCRRHPMDGAFRDGERGTFRASQKLERAKGFEPSTPTLARSCSTTELHPHPCWRYSAHRQRADLCQNQRPNATGLRHLRPDNIFGFQLWSRPESLTASGESGLSPVSAGNRHFRRVDREPIEISPPTAT